MIHFLMKHKKTKGSTGYFRPDLNYEYSLKELSRLCQNRPLDSFLRNLLLERILKLKKENIKEAEYDTFLKNAIDEAYYAAGLKEELNIPPEESPLIYKDIKLSPEKKGCIERFYKNIFLLEQIKKIDMDADKLILSGPSLSKKSTPISDIAIPNSCQEKIPHPIEVFNAANESFKNYNLSLESEKRHISSLSPIGILREWNFERSVDIPSYKHKLSGKQTSYGRGLSLENARLSCIMEAAERISAFTGVEREEISFALKRKTIFKGRYSDLKRNGSLALNPDKLLLETKLKDPSLWWMPAEKVTLEGKKESFVPFQCVFLFSNLPENQLYTALGSTGLAAGFSEEHAKLNALLEIIERDAEASMPHKAENCFIIDSKDKNISSLLKAYKARSVFPFFEDISTEFGVPAYRCFVRGLNGEIVRSSAADLSGKKAILSALTENPWPFPQSPPGKNISEDMPLRFIEDLPNFSTDRPTADLKRLESCILANNYEIYHAVITRKDLRIPVVRSIIPGLEIQGDFDSFSSINKRLFTRFQQG